MIGNNFPCRCGHEKGYHPDKLVQYTGCLWDKHCKCYEYIPDNLKYLEEKYNQQILDKYRSIK